MRQSDGLVTPEHHFVCGNREVQAKELWEPTEKYTGVVINLEIETEQEDERNYFLENGMLSHNIKANTC